MNRKRAALVDRLEQSGKDYLWNLSQLSEAEIGTPPAPGEWTIHQVVAHMRDTEQRVFLERTRRIMQETHPAVQNFDQEQWSKEHYSPDEPFKKIVAEFRSARRKLVSLLRKTKEKDWENWAMHSAYGRISLDWLAMHGYHHTVEHIAQIGYLREKQVLKELNG
ncbi:MAG: DinB family protein [Chloroflexota bacterium]|nr:DinB family protein [Chloroflexota bacterium]